MIQATYPKRLIEVDLPIKRISAHARREKSIRHGHICTLHIWWARRPLAACRAVLCAALWPDPADPLCPPAFREHAARLIQEFAQRAASNEKLSAGCSEYSLGRWIALTKPEGRLDATNPNHLTFLRSALLDFIADFANWDNSTVPEYLATARGLTQAAHEALGGAPGTRPLVVDPFAGGGSIPLEALRVGADAFASDLNPVAVLLNKVVLEYIPKYGQQLADEVRKWGAWIKEQAEQELREFYPKDPDGATPIAYLWARTIMCEGPGCGAEVPLMRSLWLAKRSSHSVALRLLPDQRKKRVDFQIIQDARAADVGEGTVRRGSATCPVCGYTTPVARVRAQLKPRHGGAADARLFCVVSTHPHQQGRFYRLPTQRDLDAVRKAEEELERRKQAHGGTVSLVPDEQLPLMSGVFNAPIYGHTTWGSLFTPRQALALTTLARLVRELGATDSGLQTGLKIAVQDCLALAVSRHADINASLAMWHVTRELVTHVFGRQALGMVWDFAEANAISQSAGGFASGVDWIRRVLEQPMENKGQVQAASASAHPLPEDAADVLFTDPPYYNAVPYADLSDFFYVWLRRTDGRHTNLFGTSLSPKDEEICEMAGWDPVRYPHKDGKWFQAKMAEAMAEGRRILLPTGIGILVFAHKSTAGWEAKVSALVDAGWIVVGSWPIDTEMGTRLRARNSAALASSIHLACRPRESTDAGDWRDVLAELPGRIHAWLPRLAAEGVVGADAIFACLGPALEIYSRYARVEKASGEAVPLREYLEQVWAAVAKEALDTIFSGADASGLEEDARLTAMWLWTLSTAANSSANGRHEPAGEEGDEDEEPAPKAGRTSGYALEYDAARKIAQGLGAHLERLPHVVKVKGDQAHLLSVAERARYLLGKDAGEVPTPRRAARAAQLELLEAPGETVDKPAAWGPAGQDALPPGGTVLDRVHQAMLLFAAGRSEALKRFLVNDGAGNDRRFWRLAQSLSALYPAGSDEKRWVDGMLARKKGLGF